MNEKCLGCFWSSNSHKYLDVDGKIKRMDECVLLNKQELKKCHYLKNSDGIAMGFHIDIPNRNIQISQYRWNE